MKLEIHDDLSNHSTNSNSNTNSISNTNSNSNTDFSSDDNCNNRSRRFSSNVLINHDANSIITSTNCITLDGVHSGIPTLTTPTLTPTTLKNIEQTFMELQSEAVSHQNEAGFVPPSINSFSENNRQYNSILEAELNCSKSNSTWSSADSKMSLSPLPNLSILNENSVYMNTNKMKRRNTGGRKPIKNSNCSPEEEERRTLRRERNKMAAARCRKRRVDHTNSLIGETESMEQKNLALISEIQQLEQERDELEHVLNAHKITCRLRSSPSEIKPQIYDNKALNANLMDESVKIGNDSDVNYLSESAMIKKVILNSINTLPTIKSNKPNRPNSLNVSTSFPQFSTSMKPSNTNNNNNLMPAETPSTGINFNFDSLMDGGTGLTPMTSIAHYVQQRDTPLRTSSINLHSSDNDNDNSESSKLVSL